MTSIDRLIYDALAARRGVVLPGEGTLEVRRRGARKISDTQIVPPQNVVVLTPGEDERARSIISLLMDDRDVNQQEAESRYGSWLETSRRDDGSLSIDGVGDVRDGEFVTAEALHNALNPTDEDVVTMEKSKRSTPAWVWILVGIVIAMAIAAAWLCCKNGGFSFCGSGKEAAGTVVAVPVAESTAAAETASATVSATAAPSATESARASAASAASARAATPSGPRFHVIAGAFAIESNADNYIARLKREHPELTPEKIINPSNGYNMVSIIQAPTRRQASSKMNLYWDIDFYLWIYEQN
jgi:cell division septation protein DedD